MSVTFSAALKRARLDAAGYQTRVSSSNGEPRCDNCLFCRPCEKLIFRTKHDRLCHLHNTAVKTHGFCLEHTRPEPKA